MARVNAVFTCHQRDVSWKRGVIWGQKVKGQGYESQKHRWHGFSSSSSSLLLLYK